IAVEDLPLEVRRLPCGGARKASGRTVSDDVPARDRCQVETPDAEDARTRHEVDVSRRFPDTAASDEPPRRCEAAVDSVQRDEVVEEIVRIVGREAPGHWRSTRSRRARPHEPEMGLHVVPADNKRQVEVRAYAPLTPARKRPIDEHGRYGRSVE